MYGFVYISTNIVNGMQYIGQTYYRKRMDPFYFGSGKAIKRALKKNGRESFVRETIFEAFTKEDLDWAERYFILDYNAVASRKFYNMTPGGRASLGFTGKRHSKERNAALSKNMVAHHPRGIFVILDGVSYSSISIACRATGLTREIIKRFVDQGIHPSTVLVHGSKGKAKNCPSPTTKTWSILKESGEVFQVFGLHPWLRKEGLTHSTFMRTLRNKTFYRGYQLMGEYHD
jgi:hypothetical protein